MILRLAKRDGIFSRFHLINLPIQKDIAVSALNARANISKFSTFKHGKNVTGGTPWAHLQKIAPVESPGGVKDVFLTLDTIKHYQGTGVFPKQDPVQLWLADSALKVGYGYLDKQGKPYGVWRYYIVTENKYSLYCEGYYIKADTSVLLSPADKPQSRALKQAYYDGVESKLMHAGEWRFYNNGTLTHRAVLANKSTMELYDQVIFNDEGEEEKTVQTMAVKWRLIGNVDIIETYYPNGNVKSVAGNNGYRLDFTEDGKMVKPEELSDSWSYFN